MVYEKTKAFTKAKTKATSRKTTQNRKAKSDSGKGKGEKSAANGGSSSSSQNRTRSDKDEWVEIPESIWESALFEGQVLRAQYYEDGMWYTATLDQINKDKTFRVTFVEYGNRSCYIPVLPFARLSVHE